MFHTSMDTTVLLAAAIEKAENHCCKNTYFTFSNYDKNQKYNLFTFASLVIKTSRIKRLWMPFYEHLRCSWKP